jgi:hypothetical protein
MMYELQKPSQNEGEPFRRIFIDKDLALTIYYDFTIGQKYVSGRRLQRIGFDPDYQNDDFYIRYLNSTLQLYGVDSSRRFSSDLLTSTTRKLTQKEVDKFKSRSSNLEPDILQYVVSVLTKHISKNESNFTHKISQEPNSETEDK